MTDREVWGEWLFRLTRLRPGKPLSVQQAEVMRGPAKRFRATPPFPENSPEWLELMGFCNEFIDMPLAMWLREGGPGPQWIQRVRTRAYNLQVKMKPVFGDEIGDEDSEVAPSVPATDLPPTPPERVLSYLRRHGAQTPRTLSQNLRGLSVAAVRGALEMLLTSGEVTSWADARKTTFEAVEP